MEDGREELVNEICQYMLPLVSDISNIKSMLYILLDKYEITTRCTQIAEVKEDRNEYLLKKFLIAKKVKGCTDRTLRYYGTEIKKILFKIGKTVDDVTTDDIRLYMATRQIQDKVSKVTIGGEIRALGSFYQWLYAEEIVRKNPMIRIDRIKIEKTRKEALTDMEIEKLRVAARDIREKAIVELLLSTGCRVTELVNIKLSEIDDDKILVHGKGQKDRYVYLNARAKLAVDMYVEQRKDKNPYLFPKGIFSKEGGEKHNWWMNPQNVVDGHTSTGAIEKITRSMAKRMGVERANPHKFRRTCATMALRRGMPIEQVSKMLGHECIATTQIYLDLTERDLKQAHEKYVI